jgi:hypothetical protein
VTDQTRRDVLKAGAAAVASAVAVGGVSSSVAAADRSAPESVTVSFDESRIREYMPSLVLEGVDPLPLAFHALHAESSNSGLNAVYGFTRYPYQSGVTSADSHLGDHEPLIVWYDATTGDVERVDYSAYHWFRGTASAAQLAFATDERRRPVFRVDPNYHHYYTYQGDIPGERIQLENLLKSWPRWRDNGLDDALALSQPFDPYAMLSRPTWWRDTAGNSYDKFVKALYFDLGISGARETSDLSAGEVSAW